MRNKTRVATLLVFTVLAACNARELVPSALMLSISDLPSGWNHDKGVDEPNEPGADARLDSFHYGSQKYWLVASHELAVYHDSEAARSDFPRWEARWFPAAGNWQRPATATFAPSTTSDLYRIACTQAVLDVGTVTSCGLLQQHGRLLSLVLVNLDPQAMTLRQFEQALTRVDKRFQSWDATASSTP